ncbi:MAG: YlxR family protein [Aggregatilineales bacterium]
MSAKQKRVVLRTCVICRQKFDKRDVIRFVRIPGGVQVDPTGKVEGRGAYVCEDIQCRKRLVTTNALSKALKAKLNDADRDVIQQAVS